MAKAKKVRRGLRKDQWTDKGNGVITLHITVDPLKVALGHQPHRGGAGLHQDKRTRRQRTRAAAFAAATSFN